MLSFEPAAASASGYAFYADYWTQTSQSIAKQLGIPAARNTRDAISPGFVAVKHKFTRTLTTYELIYN
jgi:hypothetical protein